MSFWEYWGGAASRAFWAAFAWPNSHSIQFGTICLVTGMAFRLALVRVWPLSGTTSFSWRAAEALGIVVVAGLILGVFVLFVGFLVRDPPQEIDARDKRIAALSPDTSVGPQLVSNIQIGFSNRIARPVNIVGITAISADELKIFVRTVNSINEDKSWALSAPIPITVLSKFITGMDFDRTLIRQDSRGFFWGETSDAEVTFPDNHALIEIMILGPNNQEQRKRMAIFKYGDTWLFSPSRSLDQTNRWLEGRPKAQ